ncbi:hypothetical protein D3C75_582880 [compost metagenome]
MALLRPRAEPAAGPGQARIPLRPAHAPVVCRSQRPAHHRADPPLCVLHHPRDRPDHGPAQRRRRGGDRHGRFGRRPGQRDPGPAHDPRHRDRRGRRPGQRGGLPGPAAGNRARRAGGALVAHRRTGHPQPAAPLRRPAARHPATALSGGRPDLVWHACATDQPGRAGPAGADCRARP